MPEKFEISALIISAVKTTVHTNPSKPDLFKPSRGISKLNFNFFFPAVKTTVHTNPKSTQVE